MLTFRAESKFSFVIFFRWWNFASIQKWTWKILLPSCSTFCPTPTSTSGWSTQSTRRSWRCWTRTNISRFSSKICRKSANRQSSSSRMERTVCSTNLRIIDATWLNWVWCSATCWTKSRRFFRTELSSETRIESLKVTQQNSGRHHLATSKFKFISVLFSKIFFGWIA